MPSHFNLPGSGSTCGKILILPCVHMHLLAKMDSILLKRHLGRISLDITPLWPPRSISEHVWSRRSPDWEWEIRGLSRAQPLLNCPAILILKFQSMRNKSPIALPCAGGRADRDDIYLLPQCVLNPISPVVATNEKYYRKAGQPWGLLQLEPGIFWVLK